MTFDSSNPIESVFSEIIGRPCWRARKGHGSFLTFEFGALHHVHDGRYGLPPRIGGDWHLWIYCCNWRVTSETEEIANSDDPEEVIERAVEMLDGQKLTRVAAFNGTSRFTFELGAILQTTPYDDPLDEAWMLYSHDGQVLTYRGDGCYSWHPAALPRDQQVWTALPGL